MIGEVSLTVNPLSMLLHAVLFFAIMGVLTRYLFRPLGRVTQARHAATSDRMERAATVVQRAEALEAEYRQRFAIVQQEAYAERERNIQRGVKETAEIAQEARAQAMKVLSGAKTQLEAQLVEARGVLETSAEDFGRLIAARILERELDVSIDECGTEAEACNSMIGKGR